jgi:hypothetical protein
VERNATTNSAELNSVSHVQSKIGTEKSRVGNILDYLRSNAIPDKRQRKEIGNDEDFVHLPILEESEAEEHFFFDTKRHTTTEADTCTCPPTLAQMMMIVQDIRQANEVNMKSTFSTDSTKCRQNNYEEFGEN